MRIQFWVTTLFLFLFSVILNRGFAQENYEVRKIIFTGNHTLKKDYLLKRLALKEVSYLEKILTRKEPFLYNEELVLLDLKRLTRIYQSEGFLFANASKKDLILNEKKRTVELVIQIEEGPPVLSGRIATKAGKAMDPSLADSLVNLISMEWNLTTGKRFRDENLQNDLQNLEDGLNSLGYAYATVSYKLDLNIEEKTTDILFLLDPGPKSRFGSTIIRGNKNVSGDFIKKQLEYEKDSLYNESLLNNTRESLYRLQLFRVVSVRPQKNPDHPGKNIPVEIYIEESPRLNTRLGGGYGTEEKFRAFADIKSIGLFGGARRLNLSLKHSALEPYAVQLQWIQPQFPGKKSSIAINPFIIRKSEPGYKTRTYGINIPFNYQVNPWLNTQATWYLEDVEQRVETGDEEFTDFQDEKFPYQKSGFLISGVLDNSSPQFSPERGIHLSAGMKLNGYLFGSNFNYSRLWSDFRTYKKTGKVIWAYRVMAGFIHSSDSSGFIPVEDRFYSGGSNSIRGWSRAQLGPKRQSGTPLGGKSIFESNLELRYPVFGQFSLVAFFEAGNVWQESFSWQFKKLGYAAGSGLRFETPIGPVRFDTGFPLWNEKKSPQFFISVGHAF